MRTCVDYDNEDDNNQNNCLEFTISNLVFRDYMPNESGVP